MANLECEDRFRSMIRMQELVQEGVGMQMRVVEGVLVPFCVVLLPLFPYLVGRSLYARLGVFLAIYNGLL
jgi:hypothetical protein